MANTTVLQEASSLHLYRELQIDQTKNEFRLWRFANTDTTSIYLEMKVFSLPGPHHDDCEECDVSKCQDEHARVQYIALSYVW
jgi:hypothetical protein